MASLPKHPSGGAGLPGGAALDLSVCIVRHRQLPGAAGQRGPGALLVPPSLRLQTGRAGTAGCWQPQELTPPWASLPPLLWGKGCRAASDWLSWEKGAGGGEGGRVRLFSILVPPPSFFSPKFLVFLPLFPLLDPSRSLLTQDVRRCLEIPQPTPASR